MNFSKFFAIFATLFIIMEVMQVSGMWKGCGKKPDKSPEQIEKEKCDNYWKSLQTLHNNPRYGVEVKGIETQSYLQNKVDKLFRRPAPSSSSPGPSGSSPKNSGNKKEGKSGGGSSILGGPIRLSSTSEDN